MQVVHNATLGLDPADHPFFLPYWDPTFHLYQAEDLCGVLLSRSLLYSKVVKKIILDTLFAVDVAKIIFLCWLVGCWIR